MKLDPLGVIDRKKEDAGARFEKMLKGIK